MFKVGTAPLHNLDKPHGLMSIINSNNNKSIYPFYFLLGSFNQGVVVLGVKLFLLLLQEHIMDFNTLIMLYYILYNPGNYLLVFEILVCE